MSISQDEKRSFSEQQPHPLFVAVHSEDPELQEAYANAAATMPKFLIYVLQSGSRTCAAKLRFRDPNESNRVGRDVLLYLWLTDVVYDHSVDRFVGTFFEVPIELQEWHCRGQELEFEGEDVFDWFVNDGGHMHGGFTLRVNRSRLPESERAAFDRYVGVHEWAET